MAARRTHGKKRKLTPRGANAPQRLNSRTRGGQPGNDNAWKHGRYTRELIALRKDVSHHLREVYVFLAALGFVSGAGRERKKHGKNRDKNSAATLIPTICMPAASF